MTVRECKKMTLYKKAKKVSFYDLNGVDISDKSPVILDILTVIGSSHKPDGTVQVDVNY